MLSISLSTAAFICNKYLLFLLFFSYCSFWIWIFLGFFSVVFYVYFHIFSFSFCFMCIKIFIYVAVVTYNSRTSGIFIYMAVFTYNSRTSGIIVYMAVFTYNSRTSGISFIWQFLHITHARTKNNSLSQFRQILQTQTANFLVDVELVPFLVSQESWSTTIPLYG